MIGSVRHTHRNVPTHLRVKGICQTNCPLRDSSTGVREETDEDDSVDHLLTSLYDLIKKPKNTFNKKNNCHFLNIS